MDLLTCVSTVLVRDSAVISTVRVYRCGPVKVFFWSVSPFLAQIILGESLQTKDICKRKNKEKQDLT